MLLLGLAMAALTHQGRSGSYVLRKLSLKRSIKNEWSDPLYRRKKS